VRRAGQKSGHTGGQVIRREASPNSMAFQGLNAIPASLALEQWAANNPASGAAADSGYHDDIFLVLLTDNCTY
jgi:hypothetical protein